ncbi:NADP-dependent D-sorbitol-6-phosphate dehydrogenase [Phakopsora pachyrhizi]|uniref:NADP-dependent D-sorbitol-6-phosphate dehydrogenase n=1 Tax=Phakopsora pachyrhizi TaxID=170000 RepID=A0AAV0AZS1_PHAPC|nr:NADP-dependent D-sorbitol-6-phosphate dehydrogenase [Phakopsora pachyrhizi]
MSEEASKGSIKLNDGNTVPIIAYGTGTAWFGATGPNGISEQLVDSTQTAISLGFIHLDAARMYGNEKSVGEALIRSGVDREKMFITSKILKEVDNIEETLKKQLEDLRIDKLDLYLIHSPSFDQGPDLSLSLETVWRTMEDLRERGLTKSIGVSNFRIKDLERIKSVARIKPSVNQIEFHPYVWKEAEPLIRYMKREGIALAAYGPQVPIVKATGGTLDPILDELSKKYDLSTGQILLKWARSHGSIVVTTSSKEDRLKSYLDCFRDGQVELSLEDVELIDKVGAENGIKRIFMKHMSET